MKFESLLMVYDSEVFNCIEHLTGEECDILIKAMQDGYTDDPTPHWGFGCRSLLRDENLPVYLEWTNEWKQWKETLQLNSERHWGEQFDQSSWPFDSTGKLLPLSAVRFQLFKLSNHHANEIVRLRTIRMTQICIFRDTLKTVRRFWKVLVSIVAIDQNKMFGAPPHPLINVLVTLSEIFRECFSELPDEENEREAKGHIFTIIDLLLSGEPDVVQIAEITNPSISIVERFIVSAELNFSRGMIEEFVKEQERCLPKVDESEQKLFESINIQVQQYALKVKADNEWFRTAATRHIEEWELKKQKVEDSAGAVAFSPKETAERLDISKSTLNTYAKNAGVETPSRGKREHRYTANEIVKICQIAISKSQCDNTKAAAKLWIQELRREGCQVVKPQTSQNRDQIEKSQ